ncbi:SgcJ/EcaC family oxidoreductase [Thioalkalivibrio denitrificans]|uniref:SgcJ/EcaC family oxidoreductase n=1 Tax=Thioalkalivibrio denitrificans TaxID=108003 RepID=UPI003CCB798B
MTKGSSTSRPRISGTRFIDADAVRGSRLSMSASFRGHAHPVTGTFRGVEAEGIDTPPDEACVVCAPTTQRLAEDLFDRWNDALKSGDPDRVTACYAEDAVLLPTVSNIPRTSHAEIRDYFVHFLEKKPRGTINQRNVKFGCNKITDAGIYTFRVEDNGQILEVPARYTFVYENRDGEWLIVHHHSSKMPD